MAGLSSVPKPSSLARATCHSQATVPHGHAHPSWSGHFTPPDCPSWPGLFLMARPLSIVARLVFPRWPVLGLEVRSSQARSSHPLWVREEQNGSLRCGPKQTGPCGLERRGRCGAARSGGVGAPRSGAVRAARFRAERWAPLGSERNGPRPSERSEGIGVTRFVSKRSVPLGSERSGPCRLSAEAAVEAAPAGE